MTMVIFFTSNIIPALGVASASCEKLLSVDHNLERVSPQLDFGSPHLDFSSPSLEKWSGFVYKWTAEGFIQDYLCIIKTKQFVP